jgi:hypothetical protein
MLFFSDSDLVVDAERAPVRRPVQAPPRVAGTRAAPSPSTTPPMWIGPAFFTGGWASLAAAFAFDWPTGGIVAFAVGVGLGVVEARLTLGTWLLARRFRDTGVTVERRALGAATLRIAAIDGVAWRGKVAFAVSNAQVWLIDCAAPCDVDVEITRRGLLSRGGTPTGDGAFDAHFVVVARDIDTAHLAARLTEAVCGLIAGLFTEAGVDSLALASDGRVRCVLRRDSDTKPLLFVIEMLHELRGALGARGPGVVEGSHPAPRGHSPAGNPIGFG